jgi:hypothetical protein
MLVFGHGIMNWYSKRSNSAVWVVLVLAPGNTCEYQGESPRTQANSRAIPSPDPLYSAEFAHPAKRTGSFVRPRPRNREENRRVGSCRRRRDEASKRAAGRRRTTCWRRTSFASALRVRLAGIRPMRDALAGAAKP